MSINNAKQSNTNEKLDNDIKDCKQAILEVINSAYATQTQVGLSCCGVL